uniref:Putative salivary kunitz domain protein n=1 Tax=Ixodes ricinus TaxID=34613 RepID=A0A0K8R612_IXORI
MKATIAVLCFLVIVGYAIAAASAISNTKEPCYMDPDIGPCKAKISRYYYDRLSRTCKEFFYGGCEGNGNNFPTKRECRNSCK